MKKLRWLILAAFFLLIGGGAWFFWRVPPPVELAKLAPSDALIYIETNDLPALLGGLENTAAWQKNAAAFGLQTNSEIGWLGRISANFGLGASENIVLSRARIAVVLLGFEATERDRNLSLKPKAVIIGETRSDQSTAQAAVESLLDKFTAKNFKEVKTAHTAAEGANWIIWTETATNRKLFAAVTGSIVFIGNDEQAVKTCLAVKKGEKQNLAGDPNLREMRDLLNDKEAAAFGFITAEGVKQLSEVGTAVYAGSITESESGLSLIAQSLPPFVQKSVISVGWTAKFEAGKVADRYFLTMPADLIANLQTPLASSIESRGEIVRFVPTDVNSFTRYNLQNPAKAWNGLIYAATTKLDTLSAVFVGKISGALLTPNGIVEPNVFLNAVGTEILTVKLAEADDAVTIFLVRDAEILKTQIFKRLQTDTPQTEKIGEATVFSSAETDSAAAFSGNFLIFGKPESVRKILEAKQKGATLNAETVEKLRGNSAIALTFFDETDEITDFFRTVGSNRNAAAEKSGLAVSETKLLEKGFERRTESGLGLFGSLAVRFAGDRDDAFNRKPADIQKDKQ